MENYKALSQEMKNMSAEQLRSAVDEMRRELFHLRLKSATAHVKTFASDRRKLKGAIARGLTYLNQKDQA